MEGQPVELTSAKATIEGVIKKRSRWAAAYRVLARLCERGGDPEAAVGNYRQSIVLGGTEPLAYAGLVRVLMSASRSLPSMAT